jgi:hypothetical protein
MLLSGEFASGDTVVVDRKTGDEDGIAITVAAREPAPVG